MAMDQTEAVPVRIANQDTPVFLRRCGPRPSEAHVSEFENRLGFALPADYRQFLLKYNGGYPLVGTVRGRDDDPEVPYQHGDGVRAFFKLPVPGGHVASYERLRPSRDLPFELPDNWLLIGDDAGGNSFVLELDSGTVRFLAHEWFAEGEPGRIMADSFLDLLLRFVTLEEQRAREEAEKQARRRALEQGAFPPKLEAQCRKAEARHPRVRDWCRQLSLQLFAEKGYYAVHADETSRLLLDLMFWLHQHARATSAPIPRTQLETILMNWWRSDDAGFGLNGHCLEYFQEWWQDRLASGALAGDQSQARFTEEALERLLKKLRAFERDAGAE